MDWYQYLASFFAGAFLANAVPHFVNGISGDKFPTPFAKPPGKGLSPAYINVLWAGFNIIIGYILLHVSGLRTAGSRTGIIIFFAGAMIMALMLSIGFTEKHKE
jgi:uncharacterized membrane protein